VTQSTKGADPDGASGGQELLDRSLPVRLETNFRVAAQLLGAELYGLGMDYISATPP